MSSEATGGSAVYWDDSEGIHQLDNLRETQLCSGAHQSVSPEWAIYVGGSQDFSGVCSRSPQASRHQSGTKLETTTSKRL